MVQYRWVSCFCCLSFESPSLFLAPPLSFQPDGLPLTEHWHQMCSSSVNSGTSWAECASGSVNENGCAVLRVCVCVFSLFTVVQWHVTVGELSVGEAFKSEPQRAALQLNSAMQCSTTHPPQLEVYSHPSRINTPLSTLYPSQHLAFCLSGFFHFRAVYYNPHLFHSYTFYPLTYLAARGSLG